VVIIESVVKQTKIVTLRRDHNLKEQYHYNYYYQYQYQTVVVPIGKSVAETESYDENELSSAVNLIVI